MTVYWVVLAAAIFISMGGQTLLKAGAGGSDFIAQLFASAHDAWALPVRRVGAALYRSAATDPDVGRPAMHCIFLCRRGADRTLRLCRTAGSAAPQRPGADLCRRRDVGIWRKRNPLVAAIRVTSLVAVRSPINDAMHVSMIILGSRGIRHGAYSAAVTGGLRSVADRPLSRLTARTRHYQERSNTERLGCVQCATPWGGQHGVGNKRAEAIAGNPAALVGKNRRCQNNRYELV